MTLRLRWFAMVFALATIVTCASGPAASPGNSLLALQRVGGWVVLERLDPLTLRPLPGSPPPLRVNRRFPVPWDFSPDGSHVVTGGSKARLVDVTTFREVVRDWPGGDPFTWLIWTTQGVQFDDFPELVNLNGAAVYFHDPPPSIMIDAAKGSAGLVELWELWDRPGDTGAGHWWVGANDVGPEVPVPQLDGQLGVAFAVDGDRSYLLSPSGLLAVVSSGGVLSSESVDLPQPVAMPDSPLQLAVWSRDKVVAITSSGLVLVNAVNGSTRVLGPSATNVVPAGRRLVAWRADSRDGVYVYGRRAGSGTLLFHLLDGARVGGVIVHGGSAYVCLGRPDVQPCPGKTAILDLQTGRELRRVTAPVVLLR